MDDLPIFVVAPATEVRVLIMLNLANFEPAARHGLRVLSPAQAMREFLRGSSLRAVQFDGSSL